MTSTFGDFFHLPFQSATDMPRVSVPASSTSTRAGRVLKSSGLARYMIATTS